jgi:hypothetical protein
MLAFACDGASDALLEPAGPSFSSGRGKVIASATGSGILFRDPGPPVAFRTLTFTAKKHADESVQGQLELVIHDKGGASSIFKASGKITCLGVDGNRAWIGGEFTHGRWVPPLVEFAEFILLVEDNGEGANAPPDEMTGLFNDVPPEAPEDLLWWCDETPDFSFLLSPIEAGNIQVKG